LFGDASIDRVHARILRQKGGFVLVDDGSSGGTYLNDRRITAPALLTSGDRIRLGASLLIFGERASRPAR
jgi:pSer/pThr/pTyr-binding forkhead associated (FHA) protein